MITFAILLATLLVLLVAAVLFVVAGGAGIILVFGDLVICVAIIWLLVRIFRHWR